MFRKTILMVLAFVFLVLLASCDRQTTTTTTMTTTTTTTATTSTTSAITTSTTPTTTTPTTAPTTTGTVQRFTVTFETNGGEEAQEIEVDSGETIVFPAVMKTGYVLSGWYLDSGFTGDPFTEQTPVEGNIMLYAQWELADPLRDGSSFETAFLVNADESVLLDIVFGGQVYYLEFVAPENGYYDIESFGEFDTYAVIYDEAHNALNEDDELGWESNFRVTEFLDMDETYFVATCMYYTDDLGTYEILVQSPVVYDFNENGGVDVSAISAVRLENFPLSQKDGYFLAGWYETSDFSGDEVKFPYRNLENVTLYAKWSLTPFEDGQSSLTAFTIDPGQVKSVTINRIEQLVFYIFIPEDSGTYVVESFGEYDTYLFLYGTSSNKLDEADSGGSGENFRLSYYFESGTTYFLIACMYYEEDTGVYTFSVNPAS